MNKKTVSKFGAGALLIGLVVAGYIGINQMGRDKARAAAAASGQPAVPVVIAIAQARDVPVVIRGLGNVQAYKTVAIRSRVEGQIVKISFEEGQNVKAGDQLFQIDPRPFQAALDQASANLKKDEAQLEGAQLDLERYGKLVPTGFQSKQSYDQQKATVDSLRASIDADKAQIDNAKLNLSFADIRAPIDGRTGQRLVDLGNMVQASQNTTLVTITQIKPIFVNFTVPQFANHNLRKNQANHPLPVIAYSADDSYKLAEGELTLIDNQIEAQTGTLRLKATFANTDEQLWPGEFVNVRLELSMRKDAVTVPQRVVMQGANGAYAYVIKPDNTAERRVIEIESTQDGYTVISKGLAAGEKVVLDGQYRLSNGSPVRIDQPTAVPAAAAADPGRKS
ncbi:MAG TPA: efflux RND transporter periplasmic adaptor subunit [Reyranella sp.]|jgi:multidrug efflux system membrane fusion protein|nr:efflux RND transporter periplasmic adaptor subunit [Reyranella sp.]